MTFSEAAEDGPPSKVSCPNEKDEVGSRQSSPIEDNGDAADKDEDANETGTNNLGEGEGGGGGGGTNNLMSHLPNETLDSILADAVKVRFSRMS